jgi:PAS domain S-box-containing protein
MSALRGESSGVPETVHVLAVGAEGTAAAVEGVGCVPVVVPTVDRAFEELVDGRFGCLLIDASGSLGIESVERLREAAPTLPIVAFCGVEAGGAAIEAGATDVVRATPGSLSDDELEHEIRSALDRNGYGARYHEEIAALGRSALDGEGLPALLERAVALVADGLGVERCGAFERRPDGEREGALSLREGVGWETAFEVEATAGSWAGHTLDADEPVVVSDLGDETRFDVGGGPLADHGVASGISVAIGPPEDPWGMLGAYATRPRRFTATEVGFVGAVADVLAGAVERDSSEDGFETDVEEVYGRVTDAFLALDLDARVTHLNDRAEKLLGFPREELLGREIWEPFPEVFEETFRDDYREAMERQEPIERERYYPFLDRWYEGRAYPSESGLSVYFRDITERKRTERELREERTLNERIVETSPIGITVIDSEGQLTFANERAEEIFARSEELMLTHSHDDERWDVVDADGEPVPGDELPFARVKRDEEPVFGERLGISRPDGGRVWISANCAPLFDDEGEFDGAVYSFEDVTENLRLEEELGELLGRVTDGFFGLDANWRFTFLNERAEELLEAEGHDLVGENFWERFPEAVGMTFEEEYRRAMETGEPVAFEEYFEPLGTWFSMRAYPSETGLSVYFRDVTEDRERERELQESERKFRTVAENLEEVVWMSTPEKDEMFYANPAYEEIWGRSREELYEEPLSFLESIHPEDRERVREALPEQRHGTFEEEYRIVRPDGEVRWIHSTAVPVQGEDGEVERIVGIAEDITERKEYEEYLRETKSRLEAATEAGAVGTWEWRIPEDEMVTGASFARTFGIDPEAAREGVSLDRFVEAIHEDDRDRVEREIEEAVESCGEYEAEYRVRNADDEFQWVFARGHVESDEEGNPVRFPGALVDITERKELERALREERDLIGRIVDTGPIGIVTLDADGSFDIVNERATEILGYSAEELEELAGDTEGLDPVKPGDEPFTADEIPTRRVLVEGETFHDLEIGLRPPDRDRVWLSVSGTPLRDEDGATTGGVITFADVTERRERERELERYREYTDQIVNAIDDVFYVIGEDGRQRRWNESLPEVTGYSKDELESMHALEFFDERYHDRIREAIETGFETGHTRVEAPFLTADGESIFYEFDASTLSTPDGERVLAGIARDVSERRAMEEALRERERQLSTLMENVPGMVYRCRHERGWSMEFVSEGCRELAGYAPEAFENGEMTWGDAILDEDRDELWEEVQTKVNDDEPFRMTYRIRTADDDVRWVREDGRGVFGDDGEVEALEGVIIDVTDRMRLERRLRENVETLQEFHRIVSATDATFEGKLSELLELGRERLDLPYGFLTRIENGVQTIVASEADHDLLQPGESCPLSEAYCRRTIESDRLIDVHDIEAAGWNDEPAYEAFGYGSYVGGKVIVDGTLYGTLCFASDESRGSFTDAEKTFVELACNWVATEIGRTEDQRALEQRVLQQRAVADLGQRALEAEDLDAFFHETCEVVADVLDVEYCKVLDLDPDREALLLRQGVGWRDGIVGSATVAANENSQAGYTLLSEGPVIVDDLDSETRFSGPELLTSHDVVSGISVIIGSIEDPWGILGTHDTEHHEFGEDDASFLQSVTHVLANVIERDEHEHELQRRREHLETLNELNAVIRDISHAILETPSRERIETVVCERLADRYQFAWIGGLERGENVVSPRVVAGVEEGDLDEIEIGTGGDDPTGRGPTGRAVRDREPQFWSNVLENPEYEPWHDAARERGYRSSAAIPIQHEGALYGVLNVYSGDPNAFEGSERNILTHLGEIVGHTIYAVEQRKALVSDTVTELDFRMDGAEQPLIEATDGEESTITFERTVPTSGDAMLRFVTVSGIEPDRFLKAIEEYPWVEGATLLAERGDESLFELTTTDSPVTGTLASYGGRVRSATITDGELRVVAEVPPDADVRAVTEALEDAYPGTELLAQRTTTREGTTRQELHAVLTDRLTDKQRAALETAYFAGYFDWPRTNTGEEVADLLGLSAATFTQHLRIAERKLFEALFAAGGD